eukprot:8258037-Pyramimonas_sp.AAC.1
MRGGSKKGRFRRDNRRGEGGRKRRSRVGYARGEHMMPATARRRTRPRAWRRSARRARAGATPAGARAAEREEKGKGTS